MGQFKNQIKMLLLGSVAWVSSGQAQSSGPCSGETTYTYHETTYNLVELGGDCWFASDLQTTNLNSGIAVQESSSYLFNPGQAWSVPRTYEFIDGGMGHWYDYYSLTSDKLCPKGWHVPTVDDANRASLDAGFSSAFSASDGGAFDSDYSIGDYGRWGIATSPGVERVSYFDTSGNVFDGSTQNGGAKTRCVKD